MSLSNDDDISPTEKNQESRESPQESSFLPSKETEKKIMSQEPHRDTSLTSVSPMNTTHEEVFKNRHGSFSENPNYFESHNITGNLLNPSGPLARSLDFGGSQSYLDPNYITNSVSPMNRTNEEALKSRHGLFLENKNLLYPFGNMPGGSLDSVGSQRFLDTIQMTLKTGFANKNNGDQSQMNVEASSNSDGLFAMMPSLLQNHETEMKGMQHQMINSSINDVVSGEGYDRKNSEPFGYQSNFFLGSGGNIASMTSRRDSGQNVIRPIPGFFNNDQSYLSVEASNNSNLRHEMQPKMDNVSKSSINDGVGMNAKSAYSDTRNSQHAYGEGYGTNNCDPYGYQRNYFLGSEGNNASMSSQRDSSLNVMMPIPGGGFVNSGQSYNSGTSFTNYSRNSQQTSDNYQRSGMQATGEGYGTINSDPLGYQSNFFLGSGGNEMSLQSDSSQNVMMPILGGNTGNLLMNPSGGMLGGSLDCAGSQIYPVQMVPTSGAVKNNNDQPDLGVEGFNVNDGSQMGVPFHSSTSFTNYTRNSQQAYDNYQRSGMQANGEGYSSNNSDPSGGNNASMSLPKDSGQNVMMPVPGGYSDEEDLASFIDSFWENAYYQESDNITMNTGNLLMNPSGGMLGASDEGYGTKKLMQCNIPFGSFESMMNAKIEREKITMIHSPSSANRDQWPIKKILTKTDVNASLSRLTLQNTKFIEQYFQKRLPEARFRDIERCGISVNMYDNDKHTTHEMRLTLRGANYALEGGWRKNFVRRRNLREGQEVGFFFDSSDSRLHFSVLDPENAKEKEAMNPVISGREEGTKTSCN